MTQYLVAIHHPDDYDPSLETEAMSRDIDALNDEMMAAGVRIFVGGLSAASSARSLRAQPDCKVLITDGPYLETKEHIGGFWVLEAADLDEALAWGRKAAVACRAPVEVRPFNPNSAVDFHSPERLSDNRTMSYGSLSHRKQGGFDEIHLFGLYRAGKIRRDDRGRATRNVRRML